jgi:site-specific DNA-methyltransferase (adenine-specific)
MILCDLPYGTTACKWDTVIPFEPLWAQYRRVAKRNAAIVLTASQPFTSALIASNMREFRHRWAWIRGKRKTGHLDAKVRPLRTFEDVVVFGQERVRYFPQMTAGVAYTATNGKSNNLYGKQKIEQRRHDAVTSRYPVDVLTFDPPDARLRVHPTQKPVALMEYLIRTYTQEGETVLDNCMGSGTTGVACANTGRDFIGIEQDGKYFAIAKERIINTQQRLVA